MTTAAAAPAPKKRVWVLGAGFSKPLGGPLLPDLLSERMREEIRVRFGTRASFLDLRVTGAVYDLYHERRREFWDNAEDYLDLLDNAAESPDAPRGRLLFKVCDYKGWYTAKELRAAARKIVAAECAAFLIDEDLGGERWSPYREWALRLTDDDTVVTFNYDLVLESLIAWLAKNPPKGDRVTKLRVVQQDADTSTPGGALVLKLHGSIAWKLSSDGKSFSVADKDFVFGCAGDEIAIGTPGPGKQMASIGPFLQNWKTAENKIRGASEIWFIGYRFPESDALAKKRLLDAVRDSKAQAYTVLGPSSAHTPRLHDLLKWANQKSRPQAYSLFAQDLLDRWDPSIAPPPPPA